jgi:hypothetical protein
MIVYQVRPGASPPGRLIEGDEMAAETERNGLKRGPKSLKRHEIEPFFGVFWPVFRRKPLVGKGFGLCHPYDISKR